MNAMNEKEILRAKLLAHTDLTPYQVEEVLRLYEE